MELILDFLTDPTDITLFCGEKILLGSSDAIKDKKHLKCCGCCLPCFGCLCCSRCKTCCLRCCSCCEPCCLKCKEKCECNLLTKYKQKEETVQQTENDLSGAERGEVVKKRCKCSSCFGCGPCVRFHEKCSKLNCTKPCCKKEQKGKTNGTQTKKGKGLKSCWLCRKYRTLKPWDPIRRNNIYMFLLRMWIGYLFDAIEIILLATSVGIVFQNLFWLALMVVYFVALVIFALTVTISVPVCQRVHVRSATDGKKLVIPFGLILVVFKVTSCINAVFIFTETYTQMGSKPNLETLAILLLIVSSFDMVLDAILMVTTCKRWIHCHLKKNRLKPLSKPKSQAKVTPPKSLTVKPVSIKSNASPSPGQPPKLSPVPSRRQSVAMTTTSINKLAPIKPVKK